MKKELTLSALIFKKVVSKVEIEDLQNTERTLGLQAYVNQAMINEFALLPELQQQELFN